MVKTDLNSIPVKRDGIVYRELMGEMVFLDLKSGYYYSSNEIGSMIWQLCDGNKNIEAIILSVGEACNVSKSEIEEDILSYIDEMLKEKLLAFKLNEN